MSARIVRLLLSLLLSAPIMAQTPQAAITAVRAGLLIDPETGTAAANQVILIEGTRIREIGTNLAIPPGANVIDLAGLSVLPGLVDAHNHLALTYKQDPENNIYYLTYVMDSTALRAIQAVSNGIQMLSSGFTVVRDLGNSGNYADTALRVAIEQGWIPGPTIINSGIISYEVSNIDKVRGPLRPGFPADMIAVRGNPLQDIDALRKVEFVMKDGGVFKQNGVMTPEKFFHGGPVNGWRIR